MCKMEWPVVLTNESMLIEWRTFEKSMCESCEIMKNMTENICSKGDQKPLKKCAAICHP